MVDDESRHFLQRFVERREKLRELFPEIDLSTRFVQAPPQSFHRAPPFDRELSTIEEQLQSLSGSSVARAPVSPPHHGINPLYVLLINIEKVWKRVFSLRGTLHRRQARSGTKKSPEEVVLWMVIENLWSLESRILNACGVLQKIYLSSGGRQFSSPVIEPV